MGAGAVHGQKKAERPGTASLLKMEYAPALPLPDAHLASGSLSMQGRTVEQAELSGNLFGKCQRNRNAPSFQHALGHGPDLHRAVPHIQHDLTRHIEK